MRPVSSDFGMDATAMVAVVAMDRLATADRDSILR